MTSLKRPHSSEDHDSDSDETYSPSTPVKFPSSPDDAQPAVAHPRKRLKSSGLEGGLSSLSLSPSAKHQSYVSRGLTGAYTSVPTRNLEMDVEEPGIYQLPPPLPPPAQDIPNYIWNDEAGPVIQASCVEEPSPSSLEPPEVRMKASSWYEPVPDRIVVTDLDDSEEDETDAPLPIILPSAIEMLQARVGRTPIPSDFGDRAQALALVPFRPPPFIRPPSPRGQSAESKLFSPSTSSATQVRLDFSGLVMLPTTAGSEMETDGEPMDIEL